MQETRNSLIQARHVWEIIQRIAQCGISFMKCITRFIFNPSSLYFIRMREARQCQAASQVSISPGLGWADTTEVMLVSPPDGATRDR